MKKLMISSLLFFSIFLSFTSQAASNHQDQKQLKSLMNRLVTDLNQKNFPDIINDLHKGAIVTFLNGLTANGVPAIQNYIAKLVIGPNPVLTRFQITAGEDVPATIFNNNVAVAHGWMKTNMDFSTGNQMDVDGQWSACMTKDNNKWKIVALHFSANLFDNPLLNSAKNHVLIFMLVAFLLGLAVSAVCRFIIRSIRGK